MDFDFGYFRVKISLAQTEREQEIKEFSLIGAWNEESYKVEDGFTEKDISAIKDHYSIICKQLNVGEYSLKIVDNYTDNIAAECVLKRDNLVNEKFDVIDSKLIISIL
ncbi:hypothetical protein ELQ35_09560 [Peribacillus cavernae]|uniref:Uncharacterized protein n=1 Tax=Peribacillus cavernae TaxID=1674310 RepID=A0A3S0VEL2_9BACI|nr:hypothetical protein [Peribacillus cavernae]MDQ0216943.1 hypothetical protein [Peribacillus cavernae]RUQ30565.1 hypothetical protein ELQ35_09560 [Peribacillus cavernae]